MKATACIFGCGRQRHTFTDDHHELEQVNLAVYPPVGDKPDQISANKAIYDPKQSVITFLAASKLKQRRFES